MNEVLVVDDSALMRRLICDIINSVQGFTAPESAFNAESAIMRLKGTHTYSCICYNVCMASDKAGPDIFTRMREEGFNIPVIGMCYPTEEQNARSIKGPVMVVVRPFRMSSNDTDSFAETLADALRSVSGSIAQERREAARSVPSAAEPVPSAPAVVLQANVVPKNKSYTGKFSKYPFQIVAIASSTGGPQALHTMIPMIPKHFPVPIVIVQHMPKGFTDSLAKRITESSQIFVKEAEDGEELLAGRAYIAPGGRHFQVVEDARGVLRSKVYDAPPVNNLRPCADVMYESLRGCSIPNILCTVLTGMGMDGTVGIRDLGKDKHLYVITQDQATCVVYGMPKAAKLAGLSDEEQPITSIARSISKKLGV